MIFVTGDIHGKYGIKKIGYAGRGLSLNKKDYLIIAGDFGCIWYGGYRDRKILSWIKKLPFTTLFVDGNHENFDLLNSYPVTSWHGGSVHKINSSLIHLMRGQVFAIDGVKIFTFGGGVSINRHLRREGLSWWKQEEPVPEEYSEGLMNLSLHKFAVDYIITHVSPASILAEVEKINKVGRTVTVLNEYFESLLYKVSFKKWFFGHEHIDYIFSEKFRVVYNDFVRIK